MPMVIFISAVAGETNIVDSNNVTNVKENS